MYYAPTPIKTQTKPHIYMRDGSWWIQRAPVTSDECITTDVIRHRNHMAREFVITLSNFKFFGFDQRRWDAFLENQQHHLTLEQSYKEIQAQ